MATDKQKEEFYARLKEQLEGDTDWPSPYLYSSKGTYTSVSIKVTMDSPDAVIAKYLQVSAVEGVISL